MPARSFGGANALYLCSSEDRGELLTTLTRHRDELRARRLRIALLAPPSSTRLADIDQRLADIDDVERLLNAAEK